MKNSTKDLVIATLLVLNGVALASLSYVAYRPSQETSQIAAEPQKQNGATGEDKSKYLIADGKAKKENAGRNDHVSEGFTIGNITLKYTESALALFTLLLWYSTRSLVVGAEKTAERQLRAYVFVEQVGVLNLEIGAIPKVSVVIKNSGQTPAHNVRAYVALAVVSNSFELDALLKNNMKNATGPFHMGPGSAMYPVATWGDKVDERLLAAIKNKTHCLYLYGRIEYVDAFDKPHWISVRAVQGGDGDPTNTELIGCAQGNDADRS